MEDQRKTKEELLEEVVKLRRRIAELEAFEKEYRDADEALRKREKSFRDLIETPSEWVWEVDERGVYTYVSPRVQDLLGYEVGEVLGKTPFDLMPPDERERVVPLFTPFLVQQKSFSGLENLNLHKNGHLVHMETNGVPFFDHHGRFQGYRGMDRDITQRKQTEEERLKISKLESTGILAGGIAHDFNNLLTAILGNISLAKMEIPSGSDVEERLTLAEKAVFTAQGLTQQFITFAEGGIPIKKVTSLSSLINGLTAALLKNPGMQYDFSLPENLWSVEVDGKQISQVIQNMLQNAKEAMPEGGTVFIRAENVTLTPPDSLLLLEENYVKVSIVDQGVGIPEENLSKIFDPYFSTKQRGDQKGMGLGLAVCLSIVKNHDGYIQVKSQAGVGTAFHLFLPAFKNGTPFRP